REHTKKRQVILTVVPELFPLTDIEHLYNAVRIEKQAKDKGEMNIKFRAPMLLLQVLSNLATNAMFCDRIY
ncbi:MAG: hypothetical protein AB2792_22130, partial [Candidatus Thiodiazotropha sp.]